MASYFVRNSVFRLLSASTQQVGSSDSLVLHADENVSKHKHNVNFTDLEQYESPSDGVQALSVMDSVVTKEDEVFVNIAESNSVVDSEDHALAPPQHQHPSASPSKGATAANAISQPAIAPAPAAPKTHRSFAELVKSWGSDGQAQAGPGQASAPVAATNGEAHVGKETSRKAQRSNAAANASSPDNVPADDSRAGGGSKYGGACLYVSGLVEGLTEADLHALISPFGTVKRVDLNPARGIAFVDIAEGQEAVARVLEHSKGEGFSLNGHKVRVDEKTARPRDKDKDRGGASGGKSPRSGGGGGKGKAGHASSQEGGAGGASGEGGARGAKKAGGGGKDKRGGDKAKPAQPAK